MTRAMVIGLAAWLLAGAGCATVDVSPAAGPPAAAPRPTYAVGDQWVRTDGVWELAHILEHGYLFHGPGRDAIILGRDLTPWSVERRGSAVLSRARPFEFYPAPRLDWPLQVGRRGSSKGSWAFWYDETVSLPNPRAPGHYYQRTYTYKKQAEATFAWTVEGYERVKVPAGTFEAYRLYFTLAPDDPKERNAPTWWLRIWYAPAIRQFVAGMGGASHYVFNRPIANTEAYNVDSYGVLKLTLGPGSYSWEFVPVAGKTYTDSGSGTCHR